MIIYFLPLILLCYLSYLESKKNRTLYLNNKFFYISTFIFFTFFLGFRDEVGCDWHSYLVNFEFVSSTSWDDLLKNNSNDIYEIGYTAINKVLSYKFNFESLVLVVSILFTVPLFLFCSHLKRPYLALTISYPYFFVVVGMGPIRQSVAIAFLMLSIIYISKKEYNKFFLFSILSTLFHFSGIIFSSIAIMNYDLFSKKKLYITMTIIFFLTIFVLIFYNYEIVFPKGFHYISMYKTDRINEAKSAILIWIVNFVPMIIYFKNTSKFKFNSVFRKIIIYFFIFEILMFFLIFFNNVIAYRLLLYCFPLSIYISSYFPDLEIMKLKSKNITYSIMFLSFASLLFWLRFANHAYCWLPYKNIILNM